MPPHTHATARPVTSSLRYRGGMLVRILLALFGGYGIAALSAVCFAVWLPARRDEAAMSGMLISFTVYVVAILAVFAARSALRASIGTAVTAAILTGIWMAGRHAITG